MCGIVACRTRSSALPYLIPALRRLEYRGYDSSGVAVHTVGGAVVRFRSVGRLDALERSVEEYAGPPLDGVGIGHTRWATHGSVSLANSHPHVDCRGEVHVVHNGIIENADALRKRLVDGGHRLSTVVDSELVAHLVEGALDLGTKVDLAEAVARAVGELEGSWALAVTRPFDHRIVLTANRSPLLVGPGPDGVYAASDMSALAGLVDEARVVADGDLVVIGAAGVWWHRVDGRCGGAAVTAPVVRVDEVTNGGAPDFTAKEIAEQEEVTRGVLSRLAPGVGTGELWCSLGLPTLERVRFVASGTSLNAAAVLARVLADAGVPATLAPASEWDSVVVEPGTTIVALSQSGETADVLRALEGMPGTPRLALTSVRSSSLGRSVDAVVELGAGTEVGVAATKTFTAQIVVGSALLVSGLAAAGRIDGNRAEQLVRALLAVPDEIAVAGELAAERCEGVIDRVLDAPGFVYVARGAALPYAVEGALKLKELTYRWAECQPAGELKHGPIALVEPGVPVVAVDDGHLKLASSLSEIRARGGDVLDVGGPGSAIPYRATPPPSVPWGPIGSTVVLQHLARGLALALGRDVDKPRNLAKSVTVE